MTCLIQSSIDNLLSDWGDKAIEITRETNNISAPFSSQPTKNKSFRKVRELFCLNVIDSAYVSSYLVLDP